ncbi:hypothetical protein CPB84DRAFT_559798 [Gymnopilus junonius]|uniref:Peptidase S1 domain-containing protein n=1 Tax=Gymnopilus junonius TaxID=109634 RepID=A0A9P5TGX1_GYMJU|nr:hypothetical protein CPB84DRAFT_559798 [Gymnopilus junonius]
MKPTGPEAYLKPKEFIILGNHPLGAVWEDTVGPALDTYLLKQQVQVSILNSYRIAIAGELPPPPPPFVFVGVNHGTLSGQFGLDAALGCRSILVEKGFDDIHVIIYESVFTRFRALYKSAITANPIAIICEPFSTSLGLSICPATSPNIEGTGGFYFLDKAKPGVLFLLTARHVLFHPDKEKNRLFKFRAGNGQAARKVMFMGGAAFQRCCKAIESAIGGQQLIIDQLKRRLEDANGLEDEEAEQERVAVGKGMVEATAAMTAYQKLLNDVIRHWKVEENRIIGHVTLSPPISLDYGDNGFNGDDGFTDDWAVVEIYPSMIAKLNFVGNVMDLGSIAVDELTSWMYPHPANLSSFKYPGNRLLRFFGTVPDKEMFKLNPKTKDHDNDTVIMVLKNGNTSNLTVGRLNTIRALTREYFQGQPGKMSKEVCVLPRNSKSGPFSARGDSGSAVIDGVSRVCGILTGGDGATDVSDCTFVTSINFLLKRLMSFGIDANINPLPADL